MTTTYPIKDFDAPESEQATVREPIEGRSYLGVRPGGYGRLARYEGSGAWVEPVSGLSVEMDFYDHLLEMPARQK